MEKFIGIFLVEAEPMTALDASKIGIYKGNPASDGELNDMQGYHIHYLYNNHHAWRPKQSFERLFYRVPNDDTSYELKNY